MSDFLFSSQPCEKGRLSSAVESIYQAAPPACREFHGAWGSLCVSQGFYKGFDPVETERFVFVVIGGPVLCFRDNGFLSGDDAQAGSRAILERWLAGELAWDEDLSGPWLVLIVDKESKQVSCITDLMMFIPAYEFMGDGPCMLGSHVDALAGVCGQGQAFDEVSLADFVLHDVVTYPYTAYTAIRQCHPAAMHRYDLSGGRDVQPYWIPEESGVFSSLQKTAEYLRNGMTAYIDAVTGSMDHVAQFISGGEDSRAVAGMLPQHMKRDAFIFLDRMNREGRIARKAASAYGANFTTDFRHQDHYLFIRSEASSLIGSGHQYHHAHTLGFDRVHGLARYPAVFGGFCSDSLLKGLFIKKTRVTGFLPFLPQAADAGFSPVAGKKALGERIFGQDICARILSRRQSHLEWLAQTRKTSAAEWFSLWPATMNPNQPNLYANRRQFASYEPFMCKEAVKVSAVIPTSWKLNRLLFRATAQPFLDKTKWLRHTDRRLPYFPWWVSIPLVFSIWFVIKVERRFGFRRHNEGAWGDWENVLADTAWKAEVSHASTMDCGLPGFQRALGAGVLTDASLGVHPRINFLQVLHQVSRPEKGSPSA